MIRLYFDFISPNAYLAWHEIQDIAGRHGRRVDPVPVLFAALLSASDRPGPAEVPAMWRWMVGNVLRKARRLDIPLNPPHSHPFNPLLPLRIASLPAEEAERRHAIDALFGAVWVEGVDVSDRDAVARVLKGAGLDGDRMVEQAGGPEAKRLLRERTEDAVKAGVFGVPAMLVDDELFWGFDDFPQMERFLAGQDTLPRGDLPGWEAIAPSAWRGQRRRPDVEG